MKRRIPEEMALTENTHRYNPLAFNYEDFVFDADDWDDDDDDPPLSAARVQEIETEKRMKALEEFRANLVTQYSNVDQKKKRRCTVVTTTPQQLAVNAIYNKNVAHTNILSTDTLTVILKMVSLECIVCLSQLSTYHATFVAQKLKDASLVSLHIERIPSMVRYFDARCNGLLHFLRTSIATLCIRVRHNPWATERERETFVYNSRSRWSVTGQYHLNPPTLQSIVVDVANVDDLNFFLDIFPVPNTRLIVHYRDNYHRSYISESLHTRAVGSSRIIYDPDGKLFDAQ